MDTDDAASDLELNLQFLSNNLTDLVDNSLNDLDSISFSSELSNSLDEYCRQLCPEPFPEFYPNKSQLQEDSGFLSSSNPFPDVVPDFVPEFIPEPTFQPPTNNLIPTWHPIYGNILMQVIPSQAPYFAPIPILPPTQLLMPSTPYPNIHMMHPGRNFGKKYPRRSQKGFSVVPKFKREPIENLEDVVIDLRELNIGPPELFESNQTKLMNKFIAALKFLSRLANECIEIETVILSVPDRPSNLDFTEDVTGYQFSFYLRCIINHSKLEQINAKVIFKRLNEHFIDKLKGNRHGKFNIAKIGTWLLDEMSKKTDILQKTSSLTIMRDIVLDVNEQPEELQRINDAINAFIKAVRNVSICLWSLKVLFKSREIKKFSMNIL